MLSIKNINRNNLTPINNTSLNIQHHISQINKKMNKTISASCACGDNCSCNPCLCGGSETVAKANVCAPCGNSCSCVNCQCPSGKKIVSANAPCSHCGDSCSCVDCHCEGQKLPEITKKACKCH